MCGGRHHAPTPAELAELHDVLTAGDIYTVLTGGASGVDQAVHEHVRDTFARDQLPADWQRYGRSAGMRRNAEMLASAGVVLVVAFRVGAGPGTRGCADQAQRRGIPVHWIGGAP